jgi:hypothetical protein
MLRLALLAGMVLLAALALVGARDYQSGGQPPPILPAPLAGFVFAQGGRGYDSSSASLRIRRIS